MKKRSQVAMEFLFVIGIILLFSTLVLYDIFNKKNQVGVTADFLLKKSLCLEVSSFISGVYSKGDGMEAYLKLTADQLPYSITIQPKSRNLFVGDNLSVYCTIPLNSVSNSSENVDWFRFNFSSESRVLRFKNIDGLVIVSLVGYMDPGVLG